ncbi:MAG: hypothetical protein ACOC8F_03545 [Planctomycetota bacterium]
MSWPHGTVGQTGSFTSPSARGRAWKLLVKWALAGVVVVLVGRALVDLLGQVEWRRVAPDPPTLVLAVALYGVYVAAFATGLLLSGRALGVRAAASDGLLAATVPQLFKYVPGKVATVAAASVYMARSGDGAARAVGAVLLAILCNLAGGVAALLTAGIPAMLVSGQWRLLIAAAGGVIVGLVVLHPAVLNRVLRGLSRLVRRDMPRITFAFGAIVGIVAIQCVGWLALGGAYVAMSTSLMDLDAGAALAVTACVPASIVAGFVTLISPSGLGVREGAMLLLLSPIIGAVNASLLAVFGRCMQTVLEVLFACAALVLFGRWKGPDACQRNKLTESEQ